MASLPQSVDGRESSVLSHNAQILCSSKISENIQIKDQVLFLGNHKKIVLP